MLKQLWINLRATGIYIFVRLSIAMLVGLLFILVAAGVQYQYVIWFGESSFNYIVGGLISLFLGSLVCTYLGRLLFIFARGWHMAALAFSSHIIEKNLSALDVGTRVFRRHFISFAAVYGLKAVSDKMIRNGTEHLWDLLKDVPYIGSFKKFSKNPIVVKIAKDIMDTCFDGVMYYLVKYTKPGIKDDLAAVPEALKRYLYALPQVMVSSLSSYIFLYLIPRLAKWMFFTYVIFAQGIVGGVLLIVLLYPMFYILENSILNPLETIIFVSAYSKHCKEEPLDSSVYKSIIQRILESIFPEQFDEEEEEEEEESYETAEEAEAPKKNKVKEEPAVADDDFIDIKPSFEEDDIPISQPLRPSVSLEELSKSLGTPINNERTQVFRTRYEAESDTDKEDADYHIDIDDDDEDEEGPRPVTRLSQLLSSMSDADMKAAFSGDWGQPESDDSQTSSALGGGHIGLF